MLLLIRAYVNIVDKTQVPYSLKRHFHILIKSRLVAYTNRNMAVNCLSIIINMILMLLLIHVYMSWYIISFFGFIFTT